MSQAIPRVSVGPLQNPVRGLLHGAGAIFALAAGSALVGHAGVAPTLRAALVLCTLTHAGLYTVSSLYHSVPWSPLWKRRMQRLDHSMIYLKIAGSLTPLAVLALEGGARWALVGAAWGIGLSGVVQELGVPGLPARASIPVQLLQATLAIPALVAFADRFPGPPLRLAAGVGLLYGLGALCFLLERPRLWPRIFSFHELFHVFVVCGGIAFFALLEQVAARAG